jgi:hypothetical protein
MLGGAARHVLMRAHAIIFRDALATALYTMLGLTIVGAWAGIV